MVSLKFITLHGLKFCRDDRTGYYRNGTVGKLAHRHVWECERGPIPDGWHVHHIDRDRGNNTIKNLDCMSAESHAVLHAAEDLTFELRQQRAIWFASIRPRAVEWHSSPVGREWHVQHGKAAAAARPAVSVTCDHCSTQYTTKVFGKVRFCSNRCRAAARRASGVDDVERQCTHCAKPFVVNRYKSTSCCSMSCANLSRDSMGAMMARTKRLGNGQMARG